MYVGLLRLQQVGPDVRIYAAGVFRVNRRVVPNLVVFDASGIAGDMASKGTLWLAGHFERRRAAAAAAAVPVARPRGGGAAALPAGAARAPCASCAGASTEERHRARENAGGGRSLSVCVLRSSFFWSERRDGRAATHAETSTASAVAVRAPIRPQA